jgi:heme exporter protein B
MNPRQIWAIVRKDLRIEFRNKNTLSFMFLFSFLTLLMFNFSGDPFSPTIREVAPSFLWFVFLFAGLLGLSRAFIKERERGTLEGLKAAPVGGGEILLGKMLYNLILILVLEALALPLFLVLFNYEVKGSLLDTVLVLTLGLAAFVVVGTFLSALVLGARSRELVLQIVVLPLLLPVIIPTILALRRVMIHGDALPEVTEIRLIVAYTVIMSTLSFFLIETALEE